MNINEMLDSLKHGITLYRIAKNKSGVLKTFEIIPTEGNIAEFEKLIKENPKKSLIWDKLGSERVEA